jgi:tRNA U34 2-thiouridine synthase MnmA/TrmU
VKSIETNEILGKHYGLHCYTIGQRITPMNQTYKSSKPLFIAKKDPIENLIYVVRVNINSMKVLYSFLGTGYQSSGIIYSIISY